MHKCLPLLLFSILLIACQDFSTKQLFTTSDKPLDAQHACIKIKRQIQYNANNNNNEAAWIGHGQQQALRDAYVKNDCPRLLSQ